MRISYILTTLAVGGAERLAIDLAERMAARGHSVQLLVLAEPQAEEWSTSLPVVRLQIRRNPVALLRGLWRARKQLRAFAPELLHAHCFHANLLARCMKFSGIAVPVLCTVHNVYEGPAHRMLAYRWTARWVDRMVFVCEAARQRYVERGAATPTRSWVLANGVDTETFAPDAAVRARIRQTMLVDDRFVWLSAGRLTQAKDIPNLLRAFAHVHAQDEQCELWIAGEDREGEQEELQLMAASLGISYAVLWLGLRRDLPELMNGADGFVLASAWEGMPLVLAEAIATGKPVVATDVGGVREVTGPLGFLVSARDSAALGEAMLEVMALPELTRTVRAEAGRKRMQATFSLEACAARWEALYGEWLPGSSAQLKREEMKR